MLQRANHCRRKRKKERRRRRKMKTMRRRERRRRMKSRRSYSVTSIPFRSGWRRRKSMVMALQQRNLQLELKAANTRLETTPLPPPNFPQSTGLLLFPLTGKFTTTRTPLVSHNALFLLKPCWPTAEWVSQLISEVREEAREGGKERRRKRTGEGKGVKVGGKKRGGGKEKRWGKEIRTGEEDFSKGSFKHTCRLFTSHTLCSSIWSLTETINQ